MNNNEVNEDNDEGSMISNTNEDDKLVNCEETATMCPFLGELQEENKMLRSALDAVIFPPVRFDDKFFLNKKALYSSILWAHQYMDDQNCDDRLLRKVCLKIFSKKHIQKVEDNQLIYSEDFVHRFDTSLEKRKANATIDMLNQKLNEAKDVISNAEKINNKILKELDEMNRQMDGSIESLKEKRINEVVGKQQFTMTSINNLALLLDDILQQMHYYLHFTIRITDIIRGNIFLKIIVIIIICSA